MSEKFGFEGRADLIEGTLALPETWACVAEHHLCLRAAALLEEGDACTIERLADRMAETGDDLVDLMGGVVASEAFGLVRPQ